MFNKWEPRSLEKMEVSVSIVHTTLIQAMSKFSPLLNRILKDSSSSLESINFPITPGRRDNHVFILRSLDGFRITQLKHQQRHHLVSKRLNISSLTSYRIPPVQKQKQHLAGVASCPNNSRWWQGRGHNDR